MQRHFVPLNANLHEELWHLQPTDDTLLVLPGNAAVQAAERAWQRHGQPVFPSFTSLVRLKERLLAPSRPLLPPFARVHVLHGLLSDEMRQRFHIYGEASLERFSNRFFWLFENFREQRVSLEVDWSAMGRGEGDDDRRTSWELLLHLRREYTAALQRIGQTDLILLPPTPRMENFAWQRCLVVNPVAATPLERDLLRQLDGVCRLELVYQMPPAWMQGESLLVDPLEHSPAHRTKKLLVRRVPDQPTLMTELLAALPANAPALVVDDDFARRPWSDAISPEVLSPRQGGSLRTTPLFRLLNDLAALAAARTEVDGEWMLPAATVERALAGPLGRAMLGDAVEQAWQAVNSQRERYYYLRDDLRECSSGARELAGFVRRLSTGMPWPVLCEWLWQVPLPAQSMPTQVWEIYFVALGAFDAAMRQLPQSEALPTLRRFLTELGRKRLPSSDYPDAPWRLHRLQDGLATPPARTAALLDLIEGRVPPAAQPHLLFTQQEARQLGFDDLETTRQAQRYAFWRLLCQSEIAILLVRQNVDENVMPSGLVEEALLWARDCGVEVDDAEVSPAQTSLAGLCSALHGEQNAWPGRAADSLRLPYEPARDAGRQPLRLSPSTIAQLQVNPAGFFLRVCAGLRPPYAVQGFDALLSGTLVHAVLERLVLRTPPDALPPLLAHEPNLLQALAREAEQLWQPGEAYSRMVPGGFERVFFEEVVLPFALEGMAALLSQLAARWLAEGEVTVHAEETGEVLLGDEIPLLLRGRADLLVDTAAARWLVDVKTGKPSDPPFAQLRAYELMFNADRPMQSRFAFVMFRQLLRPDERVKPLQETLHTLLGSARAEGAWLPPRRPARYDDFAPLYRADLRPPEEKP